MLKILEIMSRFPTSDPETTTLLPAGYQPICRRKVYTDVERRMQIKIGIKYSKSWKVWKLWKADSKVQAPTLFSWAPVHKYMYISRSCCPGTLLSNPTFPTALTPHFLGVSWRLASITGATCPRPTSHPCSTSPLMCHCNLVTPCHCH